MNGARDAESPHLDKKLLYDNINEGPTESVNGVRDEPEAKQTEQLSDEKEDPISLPVNGARDEESPRLDAVSADEGSLSEINYDSGEIVLGGKKPYYLLWILDKNFILTVYKFNLKNC